MLTMQWRFFAFGALLTLELALITHPLALFMPGNLLPSAVRDILPDEVTEFYLLPFQILKLARQASIMLHIFISQLTPPDQSKKTAAGQGERTSSQTMQKLGQLMNLSRTTDVEATRLLQLGFAPFRGDREGTATLRKGMKEGLVLSSVRGSAEVQTAVAEAIERKRGERKDE